MHMHMPFRYLLVALALVACAKDPTKGKAKAEVSAAKAEPAIPATAEVIHVTPDPSTIGFVGAKVTRQHHGWFHDFAGTISLVDGKPEKSTVQFDVKTASFTLDDGPDDLVNHLKSKDFLDVANFPSATFTSTEIKAGSDTAGMNYTITGNLELRGTKQSITFPANITLADDQITVQTEFGINRKQWGIVYPGMADDLIKDNVLIRVALHAPRVKKPTT
jgi:polyisoprenoid-binding protein YceI